VTVADLFCGASGWSVAARDLGLDTIGYDLSPAAVATSRAAGFTVRLVDLTDHHPEPCDGIVASPPCQPFSVAGLKHGRNDTRSRLALAVWHWANHSQPRWVAVEQVEGAAPMVNRLAAMLTTIGYHTALRLVDAETFGVPQTRRRIVLMAHRERTPGQPRTTHSRYNRRYPHRLQRGLPRWVTMAEALHWDDGRPWGPDGHPEQHWVSHGEEVLDLSLPARPPDVDPATAWLRERPATTVVSRYRSDVIASPGWRTGAPRQNAPGSVTVTVAEAGVLQGFPPCYPWQGSAQTQYRLVGNAFPPPVAKAVIEELLC
jgi:DNA (cytosine-5)-methyltransferase 1